MEMLLKEMDALGIDRSDLKTFEILSHADAEREKFIGSPTIRIDGKDISDPGETAYGLECRLYYHRDGRPSPLPDIDDLKEALAEYARASK